MWCDFHYLNIKEKYEKKSDRSSKAPMGSGQLRIHIQQTMEFRSWKGYFPSNAAFETSL